MTKEEASQVLQSIQAMATNKQIELAASLEVTDSDNVAIILNSTEWLLEKSDWLYWKQKLLQHLAMKEKAHV